MISTMANLLKMMMMMMCSLMMVLMTIMMMVTRLMMMMVGKTMTNLTKRWPLVIIQLTSAQFSQSIESPLCF